MESNTVFWGRKEYKKQLDDFFSYEGQNVALVYGRRRVGKTQLIKHCVSSLKIPSLYYECKETSEDNNVKSLAEIVSDSLGFPLLSFSSIEQILDFVFKQALGKDVVLILDEYPYLSKLVKGLDSIVQSLVDKYRDDSHLHLILCGSYVDAMKSLVEKQNPLYGRLDLVIDLKPMNYYESSLFYSGFSDEDKIRLYSVFGGIPHYNRLVDSRKSVKENIISLIASPASRFETEVTMYLKSEIQKMNNAYEVFETLAKGYVRFADILSQSKVSSSPTLADVLEKLIKMNVVKKETPINDENNKKKAGYYVCDQLTLFYFKYIYRNLSRLNVMDSDVFYDKFIAQDFEEQYVPHAFEDVCRQFLIMKNRRAELSDDFEKIGKYYYDDIKNHKNGEFDIVTENNGEYIFYEAKFRSEPISQSMIYKEIAQVIETGLSCKKYGFFSRSGFEKIDEEYKKNLILYDLKDLFPQK